MKAIDGAAASGSLLLVVQIMRGRFFPATEVSFARVRFNDTVQVRSVVFCVVSRFVTFNAQDTDSGARSSSPKWDTGALRRMSRPCMADILKYLTDLVWELGDFKQLRVNRAAVKIEFFSAPTPGVPSNQWKKLGYVVTPLSEVRLNDQLCSWVQLLQPAKPHRPEVQLRMRVVRADDYNREVQVARAETTALVATAAVGGATVRAAPASAHAIVASSVAAIAAERESPAAVDASSDVIEIGTSGGIDARFSITGASARVCVCVCVYVCVHVSCCF